MAIRRMNHAVLYVRDAERSAAFYRDVLGFRDVAAFPGGAFLQAPDSTNDHDIAFFSIARSPRTAPPRSAAADTGPPADRPEPLSAPQRATATVVDGGLPERTNGT